jgi:PKHD-type hydroxylase
MDCDVNMQHEPPVRKISMTLLLNDPSEFEGGDLELTWLQVNLQNLNKDTLLCFASFLNHRVNPVTKGMRQSLVCWFGGKPFR